MSTETLWYLARGSGVVTLMLFTLVVALGIATSARATLGALTHRSRLVVTSLHRSVSLLALVFLVLHITTLMFDPYAQLRLVDLVVPFASSYRPLFVGLGALALDLALALVVTSLLRDRIWPRVWRAVHWLAYAMWPIALLHGIGSGSDNTQIWMIGIDIACLLTVLGSVAMHPAFSGGRAQVARPATARPLTRAR